SGEAFPTPPAKLVSSSSGWSWYQAEITMHNPYMNYRFYIELTDGSIYWLNARGLSDLEQPDIEDFRINTFSSAPKWGKSAVMYQIFPDRFARSKHADKHKTPEWANAANWGDRVIGSGPGTSEQFFGGDIYGITEHLDHLKDIGVTLVYLTPVFPARSNHRYDASSFDEVDPLLGGDKALVELVKAAHKKGLKVIGDLTSNHSGAAHEWFKASYKKPGAKESEYYYFSNKNKNYDSWFGVPSLPKFNWNSKSLRKKFITGEKSIVARWLKQPFGMDGWRIDVSNMTGRIRDEDMYMELQILIRESMHKINKDTILLGEYTGDAGYQIQGEGWHGAMTYYNFTKPVWRWFYNTENKAEAGFLGLGRTKISGEELVQQHLD
ncbi:MAG: glycoside hydrolase family 13 protein, partial [Microbacteriaceae bacterium]|nr:glycoside hydrolase family 13 protein [Microbacteriaceae bacterium]